MTSESVRWDLGTSIGTIASLAGLTRKIGAQAIDTDNAEVLITPPSHMVPSLQISARCDTTSEPEV